jgi:DNA-binding NarL/FixJ family response regulator
VRPTIRVALMNDFDIVVRGLADMLRPYDDIVIGDVCVGDVDLDQPVDIALYDTYGRAGLPWPELREVVLDRQATHVAVFTFAFGAELLREALALGLHGYLWKGLSAEELVDALRRIAAGEIVVAAPAGAQRSARDGYRWPFDREGLSPRESEVLALLVEGLSNRQIGAALYIGRETVKSHVSEIFRKLGVASRVEAVTLALRDQSFGRHVRALWAKDGAGSADFPADTGSPAAGDEPPGSTVTE